MLTMGITKRRFSIFSKYNGVLVRFFLNVSELRSNKAWYQFNDETVTKIDSLNPKVSGQSKEVSK